MEEKEIFETIYYYFVRMFNEERYLVNILAGDRDDDDCVQLFINIEKYTQEWLKLFFGKNAKYVFEFWAHCFGDGHMDIIDNEKIAREVMIYYKQPSEEEVKECYNKSSEIDFPFLNWKYIDGRFYKYTDEMVDILFPDLDY